MSRYIVFEGNIGAGKTTVVNLLAQALNARVMLETFAENPFLPLFYDDPERYAFSLEMSFLADRYHQVSRTNFEDLFQPLILADYSIYKSLVFAKTTLRGNEFELYNNLYHILSAKLRKPDLVVFINRSMGTLRKHILTRGREYELKISDEYLQKINQNYIHFFRQINGVPIVVINADQHDFVNNKRQISLLQELIFQKFNTGLNFHEL